jgi:drug/metabolite transporter (DMT)-like permease
MLFFIMLFGWLFSSLLFFASSGPAEISNLTLPGWLSIAFLGIFASGLAYIFWFDALNILPTTQVGVFLYLEPIVAVIVAATVLSEPLLLVSLFGGLIILIGVWLVNRSAGSAEITS